METKTQPAWLKDGLRDLYRQGVERGRHEATQDRRGSLALAAVIGWALGVVTGLWVTGWVP